MTFVGRAAVVGAVDRALAECTAGRAQILLAEGAAGCGKSALIDTVAERAAAAGSVVLSAVACAAERGDPLGVLRQLVDCEQSLVMPENPPAEPDGTVVYTRVGAMQAFCAQLRELSRDRPVVVCVDDVQYADDASLRHLQYLARHARSAAVLVVVTETLPVEGHDAVFTTELMRQPHFRRVRLERLSQTEVADAAARFRGEPRTDVPGGDEERAAELHRVTGGNPLLLRALLEERQEQAGPAHGGPFARAVSTCLHRSGPAVTAVARAVAVLDEPVSASRIAQLLEFGQSTVDRALSALDACGVLDGVTFRHPAGRAAVLEAAGPGGRAELHRRAARVLRRAWSPATAVAGHLLAAAADDRRLGTLGAASEDIDVLRDAAEDLLAGNDAHRAMRLLELADDSCADERQRQAVRIRSAQVAWRFDPAAAERQAGTLLEAARAGHLDESWTQAVSELLVMQGRVADADALRPGPQAADRDASVVDTVVDRGAEAAERLLESARLTDAGLARTAQAVRSLICSEHPERAVTWSGKILQEAHLCQAPGWAAVFSSLQAEALLRTGDVRGAHARATAALEELPDGYGGTFAYAPAAVVIRACLAMGREGDAAAYAERQVPPRLMSSLHGLGYLRARGMYQLAAGRPQAALVDFSEVGRLMERWNVDRPAYLPWRTDAAEALLRLGRARQAEKLVLQQLAHPDARMPWTRGVSLRLRALAGGAQQRVAVLGQAVAELQRSGDRLEAARAMADLGRALQADGSTARKASTLRAAWNQAKECGAAGVCREILPDALAQDRDRDPDPGQARSASEPVGTPTEARLSASEQRVASLAAQGLTNREISAKLYLTVSTVEQHLTKVYRKLQISCRGDLPMDLELGSAGSVRH